MSSKCKQSKLLITGGAGFIGSEVVRQAVAAGLRVVVVDKITYAGDLKRIAPVKEQIVFYKADICDKKKIFAIFAKEKPDYIAHLAAETHVDRSIADATAFTRTNFIGTQVMLDAAREYGVKRFLNVSTDEVYGEIAKGKFREDHPFSPNSPYSVSKAAADMLGQAYWRTYKLPVITVRPCNNYGPYQYPEKLIPVVVMSALANKKIPVYGKGENVREWLYVGDCARGILTILGKGRIGEVYNIGSGKESKNIDTVKAILKILGQPSSLIKFVTDRLGHDLRYSLNVTKIKKELKWQAQTKFSDGLRYTVAWYRDNGKIQ